MTTAALTLRAPVSSGAAACVHCGQPLADGEIDYCCEGCRAVAMLLRDEGLERYYDLRAARTAPVGSAPAPRDRTWLEPIASALSAAPSIQRAALGIQGLRCTGCVWLIEELFRRQPDGAQIAINPALGTIDLYAGAGFPLASFVEAVERFGYQLGPARAAAPARNTGLILRLGICAALAGNSMMLAFAFYLGLDSGPLHQLFLSASWAMAALSVLVGGPVFFRSAWTAARQRIVHLDAPISLGILLAFAGSTWAMVSGSDRAVYFDTVSVFIALMLLGRVLQERVLAANRCRLLADDGVDAILCRRVRGGAVEVIRCGQLEDKDEILVAPGDLVPVAASLARGAADFSLDWVTGESAPRRFTAGETIPAGAFNAGRSALQLTAAEPFSASALVALLRSPARGRGDEPGAHASRLARRIAGIYVACVLTAAALGAALWTLAGHAASGLEVATSILVVTCPCAFGIALPLGHELVQAALRRQGMYVKSADFLDRARTIRQVVFDKTGTLTSGQLELADPSVLAALSPADRAALHDLAARSNHPRSQAVRRALERTGAPALREVAVSEEPGAGIACTIDGIEYRLGAPAWATSDAAPDGAELAFSVNGRVLAWLATDERLRSDARREIAALRAAGYSVSILSGDRGERVRAIAGELGVEPAAAHGDMRPEDKAAWLAEHDRGDTLFVGDGINDGLAAGAAHISGTPAIDRPFMATRCDFYLTAAGLAPITRALGAARRLAEVARRNLVFTTAYNAGAVSLALSGLMRPWLAAILMPISSLAVVTATTRALCRARSGAGSRARSAQAGVAPATSEYEGRNRWT